MRSLGGRAPDADAVIEARKRQALRELTPAGGPRALPPPLWEQLQVSYFMRHDAGDIAWHARELSPSNAIENEASGAHPEPRNAPEHLHTTVRARLSPVGEGLQVLVHASDRADLFARICGWFERSGYSILDAKIHTTRDGWALDTFQIVRPEAPEDYTEFIDAVHAELPPAIDSQGALPAPRLGRLSRRVRSFPVAPRVDLRPDEKGQRWLLSVTASDRMGLLYGIARVLAAHQIDVELAKITTLGERVEDSFLLQGAQLQHARTQLAIEQELLDVLEPA